MNERKKRNTNSSVRNETSKGPGSMRGKAPQRRGISKRNYTVPPKGPATKRRDAKSIKF